MKRGLLLCCLVVNSALAAEEVDALHAKILSKLHERTKAAEAGPVAFRLKRLPRPPWPPLTLRSVVRRAQGFVATFDGDPVELRPGNLVKGVRIAAIDAERVTLEFNGEQKVLDAPRRFPPIVLRGITPFRNEWLADFEGERRPYSSGETILGARIVSVTQRTVTLEFNGATKTLDLAAPRTFPTPTPTGIMRIGNDWAAIFTGDPAVKRRGDTVQGARIVVIDQHGVTLEYAGERRRVENKTDRSGLVRPEWRVLPPGAER